MNAYSLVNSQIRKKLDEMLKTWKEPVPGSLETRPVFPVETTRPIENALIKARTIAVQQQQQQARGQLEMFNRNRSTATTNSSFRNTPTPPQNNVQYPPPNPSGLVQQYPSHLAGAPNGHHIVRLSSHHVCSEWLTSRTRCHAPQHRHTHNMPLHNRHRRNSNLHFSNHHHINN